MESLKIGIVGGCLSTGFNTVKFNSTYHRVLVRNIQEKQGVKVRVYLSDYNTEDIFAPEKILQELETLTEVKKVEAIIFQIRPYVYVNSMAAIWKPRNSFRFLLNPFYFQKDKTVNDKENFQKQILPCFKLQKLNLLINNIFKLDQAFFSVIRLVNDYCVKNNIKLFIMGACYINKYYDLEFIRQTNNKIVEMVKKVEATYIDLSCLNHNEQVQEGDGFHINAYGHEQIAMTLLPPLSEWIAKLGEDGEVLPNQVSLR